MLFRSIVEPVVGNANLIVPEPGFLQALRTLCTRHGTVLIFDEVMTGFRVALGGAQALYGITPDMTTLGKVIGGGMPLAAFGGRRDIMQCVAPLGPVYQAGTLSGNPVAVAAGSRMPTPLPLMQANILSLTKYASRPLILRALTPGSLSRMASILDLRVGSEGEVVTGNLPWNF